MPKTKVLYAVTNLQLGGIASTLMNTLETLNREEFDPSLLCLGDFDIRITKRLDELHVTTYFIGQAGKNIFSKARKIFSIYRQERPTIVHCNPGKLTRALAVIAGVPVIVSTYHGVHPESDVFGRLIDRFLNRSNDKIICVSAAVRDYLKTIASPDKLEVIHNGIDIRSQFNPGSDQKRTNEFTGKNNIVTVVAALYREKGIEYFLRAVPRVLEKVPDAHFLVVGDGDEKDYFTALVSELNIGGYVSFLGRRDDIASILEASTVLVLPSSEREGFGLALVEAMAMGVPVVASNIGGIPEIVVDKRNGFLVEPGSAEGIADRVILLLSSRELRRKLSAGARKYVEDKFDIRDQTSKLESIYRELAERENR